MSEDTGRQIAPADPRPERQPQQQDLFPEAAFQQLVSLERERIDAQNRRTELGKLHVESTDAADRRQYEYAIAQLKAEDADNQRRHSLARKLFLGLGVFAAVAASLLLAMAFFGAPDQQTTAVRILSILGTGLGGYGVISALISGARRLIERTKKEAG